MADGDRMFLRLRSIDQTAADVHAADFDGDGVSNSAELLGGTDPLTAADLDHDGLPDEWSQYTLDKFVVYPPSLSAALLWGQSAAGTVFLNNATAQPVNYSVTVTNNLGPAYSY